MMVRRTGPSWPLRKGEFCMQIRILAFVSIFVSIFVAGAAHAEVTGDASAEIATCAAIADSAARLKCFDAAASRASGAPAAQPATQAPGRGGLGFAPPQGATREEDFGKPPPLPRITRIAATVTELARTLRGRAIFILDNGQVWRQPDNDDVTVQDPYPGKTMKVAIRMNSVGSLFGGYAYNLTIEGRNDLVRVYRVK
jgi:hypothetical protein